MTAPRTPDQLDEIARGHEIVGREYLNRGEWFLLLAEDFRHQAAEARSRQAAACPAGRLPHYCAKHHTHEQVAS